MVKKEYLYHGWLLLLIFVLGSNYALYNTTFGASILPDKPNAVVVASLIDIAVVAPLLFLAWKRKWSWKNIIITMAAGLILVRFLVPMEYLAPFEMVTWVGVAIEGIIILFEILVLVTLFKYMPKIVRSVKASDVPVVFSFSNAVKEKVRNNPIIQVLSSEMLIFYYAFASWRKKPQLSESEFTLYQKSSFIALRVMLIHALILEVVAVHWMLHDKNFILAMVVLVLDIYTVIFFISDTQAVRLNPLKVAADRLYISFGLMKRVEVKWSDIEEIIDDPNELQQKRSKGTLEFVSRDFEETYPTVILKLKQPVEATFLMGMKKSYNKVAIRVDDPDRFRNLLKSKVVSLP